MADWQAATRQAAERYGLDPDTFVRQIQQESGFNPTAHSGAGALGIAQIMPATARAWGVDPLNPTAALDAAARNMAGYVKKYGGWENALVAYNAGPGAVGKSLPAEMRNYIATILGGNAPTSGASSPAAAPSSSPPDLGQAGDFTGLLGSLLAKPQQAPQSTPLAPPAFAAHPVLPGNTQPMPTTEQAPAAQDGVSGTLGLLEALREASPGQTAPTGSGVADTVFAQRAQGGVAGAVQAQRSGQAVFSSHARPGDPVVSGKQSVGGVHQTEGLAGFPARDYFAPAGSHAVAPVSGTVIRLSGHDPANGPTNGPHGPLGWSVYIKGDDGRTYFLTHMGSRDVKAGQTVKQGQIIGTVADYDRYGTPSHIHMGVSGG